MSTSKNTKTRVEAEKINQDVIRSALDTTVYSVRCRCDFDNNLSIKQNKDNIRADVEENLSKLGLSIDKKVVTLQHVKALKSRDKPNVFQYALIALQIHDEETAQKMENGLFAPGSSIPGNKTGGFTVQWLGREKKSTSQPKSDSHGEQRVAVDATQKETVAIAESSSSGYLVLTVAAAAVVGASAYWLMKRHNLYF